MDEQKTTVLIVDDSPANIHVLTEALRGDYRLKVAVDGPTALSIADQSDKPDLVLLDVMMPGMDGYEVCRRLKADPLLKNIPVIFITALGDEESEEAGLELGAADYISKPFNPALVRLRVRNHLELKKQRDLLSRLSSIDGLTGISNRRALDEYLEREWKRALRSGGPVSLLMIDLDYFKLFNDNYGHASGDECLKKVAAAISGTLTRPSDMAARYGGEEFCCILPETDASGALGVAEAVRKAVASLAIPHAYSRAAGYITLSIGSATVFPERDVPAITLVEAADRMLYRAKGEGRNTVRCAESG